MKTVFMDTYQLIASINIGTKKYPNELLAEDKNLVICQGARKMVLHKDDHASKPAFKLHNEQEELLLAKVKIGDLDVYPKK